MSTELNFHEARAARVEYVMNQLDLWRNSADEAAGNFISYVIDTDYDLYCDAEDALVALEDYYLG